MYVVRVGSHPSEQYIPMQRSFSVIWYLKKKKNPYLRYEQFNFEQETIVYRLKLEDGCKFLEMKDFVAYDIFGDELYYI